MIHPFSFLQTAPHSRAITLHIIHFRSNAFDISFFFFAVHLLHLSHSLQSGYTCESSVIIACPKSRILVILEVTYSSECNDELNGTSIYAPSRCIGYYRERTSTQCNGKESCVIDNRPEQRRSFSIGPQANCDFKGQSINIEYSCIPDFYNKQLPSIDICSNDALGDIKEGFIHSPNYPSAYPTDQSCSKIIPAPESRNRLKIYALDFDIESARVTRLTSKPQINDWLEINENGEKFYGTRQPYTLLFDDVIEAALTFKSDSTNSKRTYHGFLLYFIVAPMRRSRPSTTTDSKILVHEDSTNTIESKTAALVIDKRRSNKSNVGFILLVVLLATLLLITICAFLLYKRRNDRRIRYLTETFKSFPSKSSKSSTTTDSSDSGYEMKSGSKFDSSLISKEDHIYSEDPLDKKYDENALLYAYIDDEIIKPQLKTNENIA